MSQMASTNTLLQSLAPPSLRGRVMGLYSTLFIGMTPIGSLGAGALAARFGAPLTVASGAIVVLVGLNQAILCHVLAELNPARGDCRICRMGGPQWREQKNQSHQHSEADERNATPDGKEPSRRARQGRAVRGGCGVRPLRR